MPCPGLGWNSILRLAFACLASLFHRMEELGLHPADRQVYFGQLLGMCDQISFPLGKMGLPGREGGQVHPG